MQLQHFSLFLCLLCLLPLHVHSQSQLIDAQKSMVTYDNVGPITITDNTANPLCPSTGNTYAYTWSSSAPAGTLVPQFSVKNWGFTIPTQSTITSISVTITRRASANNAYIDSTVQLVKPSGTTHSATTFSTWSNSNPQTVSYPLGGDPVLWGTAWTPDDINSPDFELRFQVTKNTADANRDGSLRCIRITVNYVPWTTTESTTAEFTTEEFTTEIISGEFTTAEFTTQEVTTESTTAEGTTAMFTTEEVTTESTTAEFTTEEVTTESTTAEFTTEEATTESTTAQGTTGEFTTEEATTESTTAQGTTGEFTTEEVTTESTTAQGTTSEFTTEEATTESITAQGTTAEFTTQEVTTESTTAEFTTEEVTTESTTAESTTEEITTESTTTEATASESTTFEQSTEIAVEETTSEQTTSAGSTPGLQTTQQQSNNISDAHSLTFSPLLSSFILLILSVVFFCL